MDNYDLEQQNLHKTRLVTIEDSINKALLLGNEKKPACNYNLLLKLLIAFLVVTMIIVIVIIVYILTSYKGN